MSDELDPDRVIQQLKKKLAVAKAELKEQSMQRCKTYPTCGLENYFRCHACRAKDTLEKLENDNG